MSREYLTTALLIDPSIAMMGLNIQLLSISISSANKYSVLPGRRVRQSWKTRKLLDSKHDYDCTSWAEFLDGRMILPGDARRGDLPEGEKASLSSWIPRAQLRPFLCVIMILEKVADFW